MTSIRVTCTACDSVLTLQPAQVEVLVCVTDPDLTALGFLCSLCGPQLKAVTEEQARDLHEAGANVRRWVRETPAPIGLDDLLEFHLNLDAELDSLLGRGAA